MASPPAVTAARGAPRWRGTPHRVGALTLALIRTLINPLRLRFRGVEERRLPASDLVGSQEICERLGWAHPEQVHNARRRDPSFPQPFATLGACIIWSWTDVREWAVRTGRLSVGGSGQVDDGR